MGVVRKKKRCKFAEIFVTNEGIMLGTLFFVEPGSSSYRENRVAEKRK
jgi:hypothetical protein